MTKYYMIIKKNMKYRKKKKNCHFRNEASKFQSNLEDKKLYSVIGGTAKSLKIIIIIKTYYIS